MRTCACRGGSRGAGERCESEPRPQAASASSYIYMSRCLCLPWRNVASRLSRLRGGAAPGGTGRRVMTRRPELRSTSHERPDRTSEPAHGRDSSRRRGQRQPINVERERQASRRTERSSAHSSFSATSRREVRAEHTPHPVVRHASVESRRYNRQPRTCTSRELERRPSSYRRVLEFSKTTKTQNASPRNPKSSQFLLDAHGAKIFIQSDACINAVAECGRIFLDPFLKEYIFVLPVSVFRPLFVHRN